MSTLVKDLPMSETASKPSRRGFFAGAVATGAAVAAVAALPRVEIAQALPEAVKPPPENGGGYSLSDHVKHYYKTARL
jgi:hypothetical protein